MPNFSQPQKQPPPRSQQKIDLYRLLLARSDLNASLNACNLILKNIKSLKDENLYPFTTSVIVCYSRPFTANKPYGSLPKKWSKFDKPQLQETHDRLITARHELFAHSDMNVRKAQIVPPDVALCLEDGNEIKSHHISTRVSNVLFELNFFNEIKETNLDLGRRIQSEIDDLIGALYGSMQLPNEAFYLRIDEGL